MMGKLNSFILLFIVVALAALGARLAFGLAPPRVVANSLGMEFVLIPSGSFMMGSDIDDPLLLEAYPEAPDFRCSQGDCPSSYLNEVPKHLVIITKPFYIGRTEVTEKQWMTIMPDFDGRPKPGDLVDIFTQRSGDNYPIQFIYLEDIEEFISRLNRREGTNKYRLPTEAEWEYAARAGSDTQFFFGDDPALIDQYATFEWSPVGTKKPNPWGLYDIYGNAQERVSDWYSEDYYQNSPSKDPQGPPAPGDFGFKVVRSCNSVYCARSSYRSAFFPNRGRGIGFRLVREFDY
ncbi:MAG: formylglycine-generating enzyme family protein [Deltaproteobacteria bacterium]|jgi:formylglycine-generating enzyme required for sulfatase activity|nr:formylglycine-generating enzyme family protein [Deltaproteobacteria bacterium]